MTRTDHLRHIAALVTAAILLPAVTARGEIAARSVLPLLDGLLAAQEKRYTEREVLDPETDEWAAQPEAAAAEPGDELQQARTLLAQGKAKKARKLVEEWLDTHPDDERYFDGVCLLGDAYFEGKNYYRAYEQYEEVVESTAGDLFHGALAKEKDVALAFLSGEKRIVWGFLRLPAQDEAIEILDRIWERVPGTRLGEDALRIKADYFFDRGDMDLAQDEYAFVAREYPSGRFAQFAMLRSAEAAEAAFPGTKFDDRALLEAQERYRQVQETYPAYAERENVPQRLEGIRQSRAEKDLDIARWYERTREPQAAEFYYRLVIADWPETLAAAEARQRLHALGLEDGTEDNTEEPQP